MTGDIAIRVHGLWKHYGLPVPRLIRKGLSRISRKPYYEDGGPWALREIDLEVPRGEIVGIIGRNGAGKSTLLKVLAGVTTPTRGTVEVVGRIFPMIELNAGLNPELTGRENVRLLAAIMGLAHGEIDEKLPDIEGFTELGDWFDRPVRTYSSGMLGRLGFGVAVNIRADVILVDETFAVGDLRFQNKSLARIRSLRESGATILLVSHSLETLQFVARHGILMEQGRLLARGSVLEAVIAYETFVFRLEQARLAARAHSRFTMSDVDVSGARFYGDDGATVSEVRSGMPFGVEVEVALPRKMDNGRFTLGIYNAAGILCQANTSGALAPDSAGGEYRLRAWYPVNRLANGAYEIRFGIGRDGQGAVPEPVGILSFSVIGPKRARGVIAGTAQWHLDQVATQPRPSASERPESTAERPA